MGRVRTLRVPARRFGSLFLEASLDVRKVPLWGKDDVWQAPVYASTSMRPCHVLALSCSQEELRI